MDTAVSFCGYVREPLTPPVFTVTLDHIVQFIQDRFIAHRDVLRSAHFKDPVLSLLKLLDKLHLEVIPLRPTSVSN